MSGDYAYVKLHGEHDIISKNGELLFDDTSGIKQISNVCNGVAYITLNDNSNFLFKCNDRSWHDVSELEQLLGKNYYLTDFVDEDTGDVLVMITQYRYTDNNEPEPLD